MTNEPLRNGRLPSELVDLWNRTAAAPDDDDDDEPPPDRQPAGKDRGKGSKPKGKRTGERFAVLNTFVDFTLAELSGAEIAVWLILYRDTRDGTARTAVSDLARRAGCDRRTVFRAIQRLQKLGLLKVVHRGGLGRGPSRYRVQPLTKNT